MRFFYLYKSLAHPETNGYVTPFTFDERLMHVKEAERTIGSRIAWLCDAMDNRLKRALGDAPNCEFVIDPEGRIARMREWSRPSELRSDLEELVGPVEHPTDPADVDIRFRPPLKTAPTGIVERLQLPGRYTALSVTPHIAESTQPFYVKLRAEAEPKLLRDGKGELYVGFHLDPLYHVHWNNLAAPLKIELETPGGVRIDPARLDGPKLEAPADADPREFLIEVDLCEPGPVTLTVRYFACNDEEGWCKAVTQRYTIEWAADRDGGWSQTRGRSRPRATGERRPTGR